jgi:hypothetical protein
VTRHRSDRFRIEACVNAWHRRFSEWERADSYLPAIAMVSTSVTVSSEISRTPISRKLRRYACSNPGRPVSLAPAHPLCSAGTLCRGARRRGPCFGAPNGRRSRCDGRDVGSWARPVQTGIPAPSADAVTLDDDRLSELRFTASGSTRALREQRAVAKLRTWIAAEGLQTFGEPIIAYDVAPFIPGFLPAKRSHASHRGVSRRTSVDSRLARREPASFRELCHLCGVRIDASELLMYEPLFSVWQV